MIYYKYTILIFKQQNFYNSTTFMLLSKTIPEFSMTLKF